MVGLDLVSSYLLLIVTIDQQIGSLGHGRLNPLSQFHLCLFDPRLLNMLEICLFLCIP